MKLGEPVGPERAEGLEICVQYGAQNTVRKTIGLSDFATRAVAGCGWRLRRMSRPAGYHY